MTFFGGTPEGNRETAVRCGRGQLYQKTFRSREQLFNLDITRTFDVVGAVRDYESAQTGLALSRNLRPGNSVEVEYKGNVINVLIGTYSGRKDIREYGPVQLPKVSVAEVILSPKGLQMLVHSQRNLVADPKKLVEIAKKFTDNTLARKSK